MIVNEGRHYLYRHIRLDTGEPFYIGVGTKPKNATNSEYCRAYTYNNRSNFWKNIVAKTDYEIEILLESNDYDFIKQKEIEFITLYGREDLGTGILCNLTDGGDGTLNRPCSQETKDRISIANKGKTPSEETLNKIKNNRRTTKGYKHTEESKKIMSELKKGIKPSKEAIEKRLKSMEGWRNVAIAKEVHKYDLEGNYIESFYSMLEAKESCSCDVYNAVSGRNKTSGGFLWRNFKKDNLFKQIYGKESCHKKKTDEYMKSKKSK